MILLPLQAALLTLVATFMVLSVTGQYRRSHRSWQAIVSRLSVECDGRTALHASRNINLALAHPWTAFRDAGVMMEMADYIERHSPEIDAASLQSLRLTAIQMRFLSLRALISRAAAE